MDCESCAHGRERIQTVLIMQGGDSGSSVHGSEGILTVAIIAGLRF